MEAREENAAQLDAQARFVNVAADAVVHQDVPGSPAYPWQKDDKTC